MQKQYINETAWNKILIFLKSVKKNYLISESKCKMFIEALYWMSRTGAQWRELPYTYGNWNTVFKKLNAWSKKEIFSGLLAFCAQDPDLEYISIDATIVRAHACAAGYGDQTNKGLGRSKGGFSGFPVLESILYKFCLFKRVSSAKSVIEPPRASNTSLKASKKTRSSSSASAAFK
ncbi:transposase [Candidatus Dependentiae bacterium]|nr:transposase [Candidatus Dependentiae bacterium]